MTKLKIFVWKNSFQDYSVGLAVVLAKDKEHAKYILENEIGYRHLDIDNDIPDEHDINDPAAFFVYGGG